jgi:hypothetical protein
MAIVSSLASKVLNFISGLVFPVTSSPLQPMESRGSQIGIDCLHPDMPNWLHGVGSDSIALSRWEYRVVESSRRAVMEPNSRI